MRFSQLRRAGPLLASALLLALAGLAGSYALQTTPAARAVPPGDPVVLAGTHTIELSGDLRAQAVGIGRAWLREPITVRTPLAPGWQMQGTRHHLGARFDAARLISLIQQAKDPRSPMRRLHAQELAGRPLVLPLPTTFDESRLMDALLSLKDELDRRPEEARMDTRSHAIRPHRDGVRVDAWATLDAIEAALARGDAEVEVVAEVVPARRSAERIADVQTEAVLGTFRTHYSASERAADRTFNLRVAASRIDGLVLMPGEELDFNEVVGERNQANGFRVAPVIASGELVDGIGGGTCQISGTLHAALFFAGLRILERRPHSRPSFYIKLGLDAAVSYPSLNFRFENDRDFPILLGLTVEDGWVTATVWGAAHDAQVSFVRRIDETTAFEEREEEDPSLPNGVRVLSQRGIPGFRVTRWRIIRDNARNQAVREALRDVYPPTLQIWRVGTGGPPPDGYVRPSDDDHPEYTADAYLSMTQGAGIDGLLQVRRAGRTGSRGWTVRAGYTDQLAGSVAGE